MRAVKKENKTKNKLFTIITNVFKCTKFHKSHCTVFYAGRVNILKLALY